MREMKEERIVNMHPPQKFNSLDSITFGNQTFSVSLSSKGENTNTMSAGSSYNRMKGT